LNVKAGDTINISQYQGISGSAVTTAGEYNVFVDTIPVKVAAVTQNYLGHFVYMSQAYFETLDNVHADRLSGNIIYVKNENLNDSDVADRISRDLLAIDDVSQVNFVQQQAANFSTSMETLDSVIVILILAAGLLAILVLYNLNNINISERRREIATLKVLGFNRKELANYIYRENIFLMFIGIVLGLIGGIFLHRYLITTVEVDMTQFGRIIKPLSWLYSIALTILFSLTVNLAMYPKIQKTDMVESLKSIE
jgi:putative ABC transport system permease protein